MDSFLSHEELKRRLRKGCQFNNNTPGLREAAREVIRPVIEGILGEEIIYWDRFPFLVRIERLDTNDDGFSATGTIVDVLQDISYVFNTFWILPWDFFDFGAKWVGMNMKGPRVNICMTNHYFYPDPAVVALVKEAANRNARPDEIAAILHGAWEEE